jgi:SNF2 family DNA or RNA helicase
MSTEERDQAVNGFNCGTTNVLVCQIEVGGVGLNLQAATHVFINSPAWNASSELQAIGRAHRTGVQHRVTVTRLVVEDSVEEYIHTKQKDKLGYAADILDDQRICRKLTDGSLTLREMRKIFE